MHTNIHKQLTMNNLYIINEVLSDYTPGMAVVAAPSLERCREIFNAEFDDVSEFNVSIRDGEYKVIEGVNQEEGVISYVYGGG